MSGQVGRFTVVSAPHVHHNHRVTLESRVWRWRLPFGVAEWRRPTAVLVEGTAGHARLPIRDVTRYAQLTIISVGFLGLIAALLAGRWASEVRE
jgi:hypothetical protein